MIAALAEMTLEVIQGHW